MLANKKYWIGSRMIEWTIDCEECDNTSYVQSYCEVRFCPLCGSTVEPDRYDDEESQLKAVLDF